MNKRKRKKMQKHAYWKRVSCYEAMGGEYECWAAHGDPVFEITCSNCGEYIPMVKGKEESVNFERFALFKKKCPCCGCRMDGYRRRHQL